MGNRYKIKGKVVETSHIYQNKANSSQQTIVVAVNSVKRIELQLFDILIHVLESMDSTAEMTFCYYQMRTFKEGKPVIYNNVTEISQDNVDITALIRPDLVSTRYRY